MGTLESCAPLRYALASLASGALVALLAAAGCGDEEVFVSCEGDGDLCSCETTTEASAATDVECTNGTHGYCCASDEWPEEGGCTCVQDVSCMFDETGGECTCQQLASVLAENTERPPGSGPVVPVTECTPGLFEDDPAVGGAPGCCLHNGKDECRCGATAIPCEDGTQVESCTADSVRYGCQTGKRVDACASSR